MPLAVFPKCYLDQLVVERTMTIDEWIQLAATELDVDGLEFYWGFTPHDDPAELLRIRRLLQDHELSMPMMCYSPDFTQADPTARSLEVEKQRQAIHTTAVLGGSYCRVLSGQKRPEISRNAGIEMVADCIKALIPTAADAGVILTLENHYKDGYWQYPEFAQTTEVFLDLLDAIPESEWFGVNYDPSNALIIGDDPIELLESVKSRVVTMHASDRHLSGATVEDLMEADTQPRAGYGKALMHGVIGEGLNDYEAIFSILRSINFTGWISIEDGADPTNGVAHMRESAAFLRDKMQQFGLP
jgi:sugar phosphate isomerase/epimerase